MQEGASPTEAAIPEVSEETGLTVELEHLVGCITCVTNRTGRALELWSASAQSPRDMTDLDTGRCAGHPIRQGSQLATKRRRLYFDCNQLDQRRGVEVGELDAYVVRREVASRPRSRATTSVAGDPGADVQRLKLRQIPASC